MFFCKTFKKNSIESRLTDEKSKLVFAFSMRANAFQVIRSLRLSPLCCLTSTVVVRCICSFLHLVVFKKKLKLLKKERKSTENTEKVSSLAPKAIKLIISDSCFKLLLVFVFLSSSLGLVFKISKLSYLKVIHTIEHRSLSQLHRQLVNESFCFTLHI